MKLGAYGWLLLRNARAVAKESWGEPAVPATYHASALGKNSVSTCVVATLALSLRFSSALYGMSNMDGRIAAFFELQDNFVAPFWMRSS